jgi:hypothetical protein
MNGNSGDGTSIPQLDGLRFLAAFIVFVSHFSNITGVFGGRLGQGAGQIGVMVFFMLSAFLMGWLYFPDKISAAGVAGFARRRAARILPLYYSVVIGSWLALKLLGPASPTFAISDRALLDNILLIHGTGELWTIPVEVHFYLVFPLLWWLHSRSAEAALAGLTLAILVLAYVDFSAFGARPSIIRHGHYFLMGCLCAVLHLQARTHWPVTAGPSRLARPVLRHQFAVRAAALPAHPRGDHRHQGRRLEPALRDGRLGDPAAIDHPVGGGRACARQCAAPLSRQSVVRHLPRAYAGAEFGGLFARGQRLAAALFRGQPGRNHTAGGMLVSWPRAPGPDLAARAVEQSFPQPVISGRLNRFGTSLLNE